VKTHAVRSRVPPAARLLLLVPIAIAGALLVQSLTDRIPPPPTPVVAAAADSDRLVQAPGTVEPAQVVEIKSKASGAILSMPVETGSRVRAGDLLAQIDPRSARDQYGESRAALSAAERTVAIAREQKERTDELFAREMATVAEHDSAAFVLAEAESGLAGARSDLETARQALRDAAVRAPLDGTVLEQDATAGSVVTSSASVSDGTTLLKLADLDRLELQALVPEADIGRVRTGEPATILIDAFPDRSFEGQVTKVEPEAMVDSTITLFPVLISISNPGGVLLPGMNGEVTIDVESRASGSR
jgi:HlyD family secretion protein